MFLILNPRSTLIDYDPVGRQIVISPQAVHKMQRNVIPNNHGPGLAVVHEFVPVGGGVARCGAILVIGVRSGSGGEIKGYGGGSSRSQAIHSKFKEPIGKIHPGGRIAW